MKPETIKRLNEKFDELLADDEVANVGLSGLNGVLCLPLPDGMTRMESGPVQFGDDWPGIFLRGDNAKHYAFTLACMLGSIERGTHVSEIDRAIIRDLMNTLDKCSAT